MKSTISKAAAELYRSSLLSFSILTVTLLLITSFVIFNQDAHAERVCKVEQLTNDQVDDSDQPSISGDGNLVAFRSEADFTGQNPENNDEIFLYNVREEIFTQVTVTTMGDSSSPFISPDGKAIAFASDGNINGVPNNGNDQIFHYDVMTGDTEQVTNGTDGNSGGPSLNGTRTQIAFESQADLTGDNPLNLLQIFLFDITSGTFKQITNSVLGITVSPSSNFEGDRITFRSSADLTGQNPDNRDQVFLYDGDTDSLSQITHNTAGGSTVTQTRTAIDGSGNLIALSASGNPNGGGGSFGGSQIYLFDGSSPFEQITQSQEALANQASINEDGTCIVLTSRDDITGQNPQEFRQVFLYDIATMVFTQVTNFQTNNPSDPVPNADCTRISFRRQISTGGPNVSQIYLATCLDPATARSVPALSEWGLMAMAGLLGIAGLLVVRRRKAAV